jgi:pilus assembly protein CpaB
VLFVNRDVATDAPLETGWFEVREVPVEFVHPLAAAAADRDLLTAARAAHPLRAGQPLLWSDVADPASFATEMASLVRPNERAVSLRVSEVSGVGRLIRNNDHVDIFGTFDRPDGAVVTVPILQNVTVVAVGQSLHGDSGGDYATLSVSVSPQEAAMLTLAQETGRLTYVLRNNHDWETVPTLQRVSLDDLFEDAKRKIVQDNRDIRIVKGKL